MTTRVLLAYVLIALLVVLSSFALAVWRRRRKRERDLRRGKFGHRSSRGG